VAAIVAAALAAPAWAQRPPKQPDNVKEGSPAPDFTLQDMAGKKTVKLAELKGKPVVLIFGSCT
jgi:cytochrome oxidase Cu insertion factor (SCO1/SenC/PrrC family)